MRITRPYLVFGGAAAVFVVAMSLLVVGFRERQDFSHRLDERTKRIDALSRSNQESIKHLNRLTHRLRLVQRAEITSCRGRHVLVGELLKIARSDLRRAPTAAGKNRAAARIRALEKIDCHVKPRVVTKHRTRTVVLTVRTRIRGKIVTRKVRLKIPVTVRKPIKVYVPGKTVTITTPGATTTVPGGVVTIPGPTVTETRTVTLPAVTTTLTVPRSTTLTTPGRTTTQTVPVTTTARTTTTHPTTTTVHTTTVHTTTRRCKPPKCK